MIVLDTNVFSALMYVDGEAEIKSWIDRHQLREFHLPTPAIFEIHYGIARLPVGRKQRDLERRFNHALSRFIADRVLPFDARSAETAGVLFAIKAIRGRNERAIDIQIAGIAKALNASVATRNVKDFTGMGITIINPWDAV